MDNRVYKTASANAATVDKQWLLIDAEGQTSAVWQTVASLLRGKHKTNFTPFDCGDNVVIINVEKIRSPVTSGTKEYVRFTGYPGGQRFALPKSSTNATRFHSKRAGSGDGSPRTAPAARCSATCIRRR